MANKKHLAILKQGVVAWNEWRENHPEIKVDLLRTYLLYHSLRRVLATALP